MDPWRLTMVDTATTWSGSVEWRIPRNNPRRITVTKGTRLLSERKPLAAVCQMGADDRAEAAIPAPNITMNADDNKGR